MLKGFNSLLMSRLGPIITGGVVGLLAALLVRWGIRETSESASLVSPEILPELSVCTGLRLCNIFALK